MTASLAEGLKKRIPENRRGIIKAAWRNTAQPFRRATAALRPLPDTLVIGAQKSGTTSLHRYLCQHPDIVGGTTQETHFFDDRFHKGIGWYRSQFPLRPARRVLDVTPTYMFKVMCFDRIRAWLPHAKLIAVVREPVARAYSHYRHVIRGMGDQGREELEFAGAVQRDMRILERGKILGDNSYHDKYHSYVRRGIYVAQLLRFATTFGDELLVIPSRDLFERPKDTANRVFGFLGLPGFDLTDVEPRNQGSYPRADIPMRTELQEFFEPYNQQLYELLGVEPWWPYD